MNFRHTWAIFRKEVIHIKGDPGSLSQAILLPVTLRLLHGYALTLDIKHVPLAVYDQNRSRISQDFINRFAAARSFDVKHCVSSFTEAVYCPR